MFKKSSKFFLTILLCEILMACFFIVDFVGAAGAATYTPTYLKGFSGNPAELVINIYKYALGAVGIVAFGTIVYGAILRITSAGNPSQVQEANAWIIGAVSGIALLFGSYLILETINPKLVDIGNIEKMITPTIKVTTPTKNPFVNSLLGTSSLDVAYTAPKPLNDADAKSVLKSAGISIVNAGNLNGLYTTTAAYAKDFTNYAKSITVTGSSFSGRTQTLFLTAENVICPNNGCVKTDDRYVYVVPGLLGHGYYVTNARDINNPNKWMLVSY